MSRIRIFTGHFGSGKTEIAINFARGLALQNIKTCLVDIDIVNPYFCVRDLREELEEVGIRLIASNPHFSNAELAVVPAEVVSVFNDKSRHVIIDVGGDDSGAAVLGRYYQYFTLEPYEMYFVINNNRPFTSNLEDTKEYIKTIERASRLKVTHLISNTNMSYETTVEDILKGDKLAGELSKELNIPYRYTVCKRDFIDEIKGKVAGEILPIDIYMRPEWL
ncbi:ATP-binding protein [Clostridium thermarum]|uniref:ATP-binding protein n=1 Tax=Clostridium thermarum TaxID=1716543 RepID=UPI001120DB39|nr:ATP-binding protein [Clostridium thermarum]